MPKVDEMLGAEPPGPDWKPNTKYLYTVASQNGWRRQDVHAMIDAEFKKVSTKDLTYEQYNQTLELLTELHPSTYTREVPDMPEGELF